MTFSIRSLSRALIVVGGLGSVIGCAQHAQQPPLPPPLLIDGAMERRDWNRSVAYYPSGAVRSWHKRFFYTPSPNRPDSLGLALEPVFFVGQTLYLPVTLVTKPIGTKEVYHGLPSEAPTYTGVPPLPPPVNQSAGGR